MKIVKSDFNSFLSKKDCPEGRDGHINHHALLNFMPNIK
jgi:hypothetical protein